MPTTNFKRVILHCGLHKTGSSYLQTVFAANRDILAQNSIHYPRYRTAKTDAYYGIQHSIVAMDYKEKGTLFPLIAHFLDYENPDCDTLFLSGEEFTWMYNRPDFFEELKDLAPQVTAIFYLRRFDHLMERVYSESVKVHLTGGIEKASYQPSLLTIVNPYIEALGHENVILRPYTERLWPDGSLGRDFFSAIGLPEIWPSLASTEARVNAGLPRPETYLLSLVETEAEKARLMAHFKTSPVPVTDKALFFRSPGHRQQYARNNALLRNKDMENYVGDLVDFLDLDNIHDDPHWTKFNPDNPVLAEYLAAFRVADASAKAAAS